ncbi:MAG: Na/Pi cotransporter family protein, partial [Verrucomicrobia bacterium]
MILTIFEILGSLGVFLFGMKVMSEGIQKVSGNRLRGLMRTMTSNRFAGITTGVLITSLVQSSSATTVMIVSFVNAQLITLTESIGLIMGANLGTTTTFWIVSFLGFKFSLTSVALPIIGIGLPLIFVKNVKVRNTGEIFIGFG